MGGDVRNVGTPYAMLKLRPAPGFTAIIQDYDLKDYINTGFGQAEYAFQIPKDMPQWIVGANVIAQESIGANLLTGSPFQTYQASGRARMTYSGFIAFAAGSVTGDESRTVLAVRYQAELHRHAAGVVRQCQRKGHRRQRRV